MKNNLTTEFRRIINSFNDKSDTWSYLTSVEYMLNSNLYMESVIRDARMVSPYITLQSKILDFGTGSGIFAVNIRNNNQKIKIWAVDSSEDKSEKNPNFVDSRKQQDIVWNKIGNKYSILFSHYDGEKLPYPDGSFDIITAYAVLEHVPPAQLNSILRELNRVLNQDGYLFVFKCPRKYALIEHFAGLIGMGRHEVLYGDSEMRNLIMTANFTRIKEWKSDMVFKFPGKITNRIYVLLKIIDAILITSPLKVFAHNVNYIFRKNNPH